MIKKHYEIPETEIISVKIEENMMASDFEVKQLQQGDTSWWEDAEE